MDDFEDRLHKVANHFPYPPTPLIRERWHGYRPPAMSYARRAAAMIALLLVIVMVTPLRAAILDLLRIGAVTIISVESPTASPSLPSLVDLFGATTFDEAMQGVNFPLRLPSDFGPPDHVYQQGDSVITVWQAENNQPALALYQIGRDDYVKMLSMAHNTQVGERPAVWTEMPHTLQYQQSGEAMTTRQTVLVTGHVLIWQDNDITYRLESALSLEEAVAVAEALQ